MALTPDDVVRLAGLARIDLTDDETAYLAPQLDAICSVRRRHRRRATYFARFAAV